jgi:DNA-binding transcriptional ArsR family regulator
MRLLSGRCRATSSATADTGSGAAVSCPAGVSGDMAGVSGDMAQVLHRMRPHSPRKTLSKRSFERYDDRVTDEPVTGEGADQAEAPGSPAVRRTIADAPSLKALAHPTRLALIEAIGLSGSLTATQASGLVGESPTACAYHLRTLARHGFVEEAGGGRGRERPWRLAQVGMSFDEHSDDPATALAGRALSKMLNEMWIDRIRAFELAKPRHPKEVREVTDVLQSVVFASPAELAQLREEIFALFCRYLNRIDPADRPPDSLAFEMVLFTHVLQVRE